MKQQIAEIELRGNRLIMIQHIGITKQEIDVTAVWHFFKDVEDFVKQPAPITNEDNLK